MTVNLISTHPMNDNHTCQLKNINYTRGWNRHREVRVETDVTCFLNRQNHHYLTNVCKNHVVLSELSKALHLFLSNRKTKLKKNVVSFLKNTLAVETWSEGKDSGTVGNVVLIPADMMYQDQQCKNSFQLPIVNY